MINGDKISSLELAGWGGGPGMVYGITFIGPMSVYHSTGGLIMVKCLGDVDFSKHAARLFPKQKISKRDSDNYRTLEKGTSFEVHPSHVRVVVYED